MQNPRKLFRWGDLSTFLPRANTNGSSLLDCPKNVESNKKEITSYFFPNTKSEIKALEKKFMLFRLLHIFEFILHFHVITSSYMVLILFVCLFVCFLLLLHHIIDQYFIAIKYYLQPSTWI